MNKLILKTTKEQTGGCCLICFNLCQCRNHRMGKTLKYVLCRASYAAQPLDG